MVNFHRFIEIESKKFGLDIRLLIYFDIFMQINRMALIHYSKRKYQLIAVHNMKSTNI